MGELCMSGLGGEVMRQRLPVLESEICGHVRKLSRAYSHTRKEVSEPRRAAKRYAANSHKLGYVPMKRDCVTALVIAGAADRINGKRLVVVSVIVGRSAIPAVCARTRASLGYMAVSNRLSDSPCSLALSAQNTTQPQVLGWVGLHARQAGVANAAAAQKVDPRARNAGVPLQFGLLKHD